MIEEKILKILEFDKILNKISSFAVLNSSKDEIKTIKPSFDISEINFNLKKVEESDKLLYKYGVCGVDFFDNINDELERASVGAMLNCAEILRVARLLKASRITKNSICAVKDEEITLVNDIAERLFTNSALENELTAKILSEDLIADNASEKLYQIRNKIRRLNDQLREKLSSYMRSETSKYLQDGIVTMRENRYVLPVKQEYRGQVKGLIHDQSSSGATLFIEPEAVVELNNDLKTQVLAESSEIERILIDLSGRIGVYKESLKINIQLLIELDISFAKAEYAYKNRCIKPKINTQGIVNIKKGRHPLIDSEKVVPLDISLGDKYLYVLLTGPNTGGKTVSLKLIGLFSIMGMSGIYIPALDGSEISIFEDLFCDIGDEQSIEQSLSTFSSHMVNIINILNKVNEKSLVLLDEIGAGTDPEEGSSLALAIISKLLEKKSRGLITTHYSVLKEYAFSDKRIINASMEFDSQNYEPKYKINIGIPGSSNAIEIAKRLGLPKEIADSAEGLLSGHKIEFEKVLKSAEIARLQANEKTVELDRLIKERESELILVKEEKEKLIKERDKVLKTSRIESRRIVNEKLMDAEEILEKLNEILNKESISQKDIFEARGLKNILEDKKYNLEESDESEFDLKPIDINKIKIGDIVFVKSMNNNGVIKNINQKKKEFIVNIGNIEVTAKLKELYKNNQKIKANSNKPIIKAQYTRNLAEIPITEVKVLGMNSEECLMKVEEFLDKAMMTGILEVKIIHGVGAGVLKRAIWEYLKNCSFVESFRLGKYGEGESGVTFVTLK